MFVYDSIEVMHCNVMSQLWFNLKLSDSIKQDQKTTIERRIHSEIIDKLRIVKLIKAKSRFSRSKVAKKELKQL